MIAALLARRRRALVLNDDSILVETETSISDLLGTEPEVAVPHTMQRAVPARPRSKD